MFVTTGRLATVSATHPSTKAAINIIVLSFPLRIKETCTIEASVVTMHVEKINLRRCRRQLSWITQKSCSDEINRVTSAKTPAVIWMIAICLVGVQEEMGVEEWRRSISQVQKS